MDSFEKLQRAIALRPTPEIPVYPHIVTFAGRCAGITQQQLFSSNQAWLNACDKTFAQVGKPDVVFPLNPFDTDRRHALARDHWLPGGGPPTGLW